MSAAARWPAAACRPGCPGEEGEDRDAGRLALRGVEGLGEPLGLPFQRHRQRGERALQDREVADVAGDHHRPTDPDQSARRCEPEHAEHGRDDQQAGDQPADDGEADEVRMGGVQGERVEAGVLVAAVADRQHVGGVGDDEAPRGEQHGQRDQWSHRSRLARLEVGRRGHRRLQSLSCRRRSRRPASRRLGRFPRPDGERAPRSRETFRVRPGPVFPARRPPRRPAAPRARCRAG